MRLLSIARQDPHVAVVALRESSSAGAERFLRKGSPMLTRIVRPLDHRTHLRVWRCAEEIRGTAAHAGLELALVQRGRAEYRVGHREIVAGRDELVVVPARVEHLTTLSAGDHGTVIELPPSTMDEIAEVTTLAGRRFDECQRVRDEGLLSLLFALELESRAVDEGRALAVEGLLDALVVRLLRLAPERDGRAIRDPRVRAAIDHVHAHLGEVTLADLARTATMSRFHFSRRFREATGLSPHAFIVRARAQRAAELLRQGRRSVTEAAFEAGFSDLGRFRAAFRRHVGVAPSHYAAQHDRASPAARA